MAAWLPIPQDHWQNGTPIRNMNVDNEEEALIGETFAKKSMKALGLENGVYHLEGIRKQGGENHNQFYFLETKSK